MSATGPRTFAEHQIPDVLALLQAIDAQLKANREATGNAVLAAQQVYTLPVDLDNVLDILVAGGRAKGQFESDYVAVGANSTSTLTIDVSQNQVLVIRGILTVAPFTQNSGFLATVTIDGANTVANQSPLLDSLPMVGAQLPAAEQSIVFSFDNTTSSSLTGYYQIQEVLLSASDYKNLLVPMLRAQADAALHLQGA